MEHACFVLLLAVATATAVAGQTFNSLLNFNGTNGAAAGAPLVQGTDGNYYGTTLAGGAYSAGTVFQWNSAGIVVLYNFCSQPNCADGNGPQAGLVLGSDGNFYGVTEYGGTSDACSTEGCGTVFKITVSGALSTLHSFVLTDGEHPAAALTEGADGNFYGTTSDGGSVEGGTVFKVTPAGALTTLHNFTGTEGDGKHPLGGLVQGANGDLYGATSRGGGALNRGTMYKITLAGALTTLHTFVITDGGNPDSAPVQAANGDFYGTTAAGGDNDSGTIYMMTPSGVLTRFYSFCSQHGCADGANPRGGLVLAQDGNFYGATYNGGANGAGALFKITPNAVLTTLHSFDNSDGCHPTAGMMQATNGVFYGPADSCGADGDGTLYSLSTGLGSFVAPAPAFGVVGASFLLLGTNMAGATGVTLNGMPAAFTLNSPTLITVTVPPGATTGPVQVMTPGGTLVSNVQFQVGL